MLSTLTQTCLSVPQFGSCSSFGTFRPAFSHTGTIIRPLSVILPASPTFNHSPGSNTPSPTSKVPSWKVCFHLQFCFWVFSFCRFFASCFNCFSFALMRPKDLTITILLLLIKTHCLFLARHLKLRWPCHLTTLTRLNVICQYLHRHLTSSATRF